MKTSNRLHHHTAYMASLEVELSSTLDGLSEQVVDHPEVSESIKHIKLISESHLAALQARLKTIVGEIDLPDSSLPKFKSVTENYPVSSALQNISAHLNHAIIGYSMLRSIALRYRDSSLIGNNNTGDLAEQHTKQYVNAVHEINRTIHSAVLWEMDQDGHQCQCTCPSCGLGICMCAQGPRKTLSDIWLEPGPISTESEVFVHSPRQDSAADKAGLHHGDVVLAADGQELESHFTLQGTVSAHEPGEKVVLRIRRNTGELEEISITCP